MSKQCLQAAANEIAIKLGKLLLSNQKFKIVFAESCTAGLVSGLLAQSPGISSFLCGSAVTYQEQTKSDWINVSSETIEKQTAVCEDVAVMMAMGVLEKTQQANLSVSITGHLGPNAPEKLDGVVYIALATRATVNSIEVVDSKKIQLVSQPRLDRQYEAASNVLSTALQYLESSSSR